MSANVREKMKRAFAYVDSHFDDMIEDVRASTACPSVAGNREGLEATRAGIVGKMRGMGLVPSLHEVAGGNALIAAEARGADASTLLFYNHYDVVEPGKPEHWTKCAPFAPCVAEGRIWGRGVSDNKGPLFSRLHAVEAVLATAGALPVGVKFLFEGDEETSSPSMCRFARQHPETFRALTHADVCVWENGRNDAAGHTWLRMGVRGNVGFDLRVTTARKDVHGRMGASVPSASWRLVWALSTLKTPDERVALEGFYDRIMPVGEDDLEALRAFPYDEASVREGLGIPAFLKDASGEALKKQIYLEPSVSICAIEAGEPHNGVRGIVPHTASAHLSFYLVADQDPVEVKDSLRRHLDEHGFPDVEILQSEPGSRPVRTPVSTPFRQRAFDVAGLVYDKPMVIELTQLGAGPAAVFRDAWPDLPIVGFGPGNTDANHHAPDENMKLEDYRKAVKYLIALFYSYAE